MLLLLYTNTLTAGKTVHESLCRFFISLFSLHFIIVVQLLSKPRCAHWLPLTRHSVSELQWTKRSWCMFFPQFSPSASTLSMKFFADTARMHRANRFNEDQQS